MKKISMLLLLITTSLCAHWRNGNVHIFGDSHSAYSFTNIDSVPPAPTTDVPLIFEKSMYKYSSKGIVTLIPFYIHWISRTMHMVGKLGLELLDFRKYDVKNGDTVVMVFGGIDSWHGSVIKQYCLGRELDEIIETLTNNFMRTVVANKKLYRDLNIVIMSVVPPIFLQHNKEAYKQRDENLPFTAFIVKINCMLNEYLARQCVLNNFAFLDVTSFYKNDEGMLRVDLADLHHVKVSSNYIIKKRLVDLILAVKIRKKKTISKKAVVKSVHRSHTMKKNRNKNRKIA